MYHGYTVFQGCIAWDEIFFSVHSSMSPAYVQSCRTVVCPENITQCSAGVMLWPLLPSDLAAQHSSASSQHCHAAEQLSPVVSFLGMGTALVTPYSSLRSFRNGSCRRNEWREENLQNTVLFWLFAAFFCDSIPVFLLPMQLYPLHVYSQLCIEVWRWQFWEKMG